MSAQPQGADANQNMQPVQLQGPTPFSKDELANFMEIVSPEGGDKETQPEKEYLTKDQFTALMDQNLREIKQENTYLRTLANNLSQNRSQADSGAAKEEPKESVVPVRFVGEQQNAVVMESELKGLIDKHVQSALDQFNQEVIQPYAPTVMRTQQDIAINQAVDFLKNQCPEVLEGRDARQMGQAAIDLFNSSFNPGQDDNGKAQYAVTQLRNIAQTGNSTGLRQSTGGGTAMQTAPVYNQVGRTQSGVQPQNPWGFRQGQTVKLKSMSINQAGGIDAYSRYAAEIDAMYRYNEMNKLGLKFVYE